MARRLQHAQKLLRAGEPQHAAAVLDELLKTEPRNANALQLRAMAAQQLGDPAQAERLLRQAVEYAPDSWAAHSNLGNVMRATGKIDAAERHLRQALTLAPDSPVVMVNLANTLVDQKRPGEAIALYRKAAEKDPKKPNLWRGLGIASMQNGDLDGAAAAYRQLVGLLPEDAAAWNDLGTALLAVEKIDEAEESFRRAIELAPGSAPPFFNLGNVGLRRGDPAGALRAYDAALERDPGMKQARINRSKARFDMGERQASIGELRSLLKDDRDNVDARFRLAEALERSHEVDDAVSEVELLMAGPGAGRADVRHVAARVARRQGDPDRAVAILSGATAAPGDHELAGNIHNELARGLDAIGDYDSAFEHFAKAKEHFSLTHGYRNLARDGFRRELRGRREAMTPDWASALPRLEADGFQPVFLVGFPRSGTTLVEQILDAHPSLTVLGELPLLNATIRRCRELVTDYPTGISTLSQEQLQELRTGYLEAVREHLENGQGQQLVDKNPLYFCEMPFILQLFPAARFVFVRRDPRDAVLSGFMQSFAPNPAMASFLSLDDAARFYDESAKLWDDYRELFDPEVFELRYEELLEDFDEQVRKLLEFVGVGWDESVTAFHRHAREQLIKTPSYSQVSQPLYTTSRGRWRNYETQLTPVLETLAPHVQRQGY